MAIPRDLYQERLRLGVCPWCGCKRDGSTKRCSACAKLHNERTMRSRRKRTKAGVCWRCSNTVATGSVLCNLCKSTVTIATTKLYARKKAAGLCCWCSEPRTIGRFCRSCWFRGVSLRVFKTISRGDELKALFELQGERCAYTGVVLVPGKNAGIDHRIPITRGGTSEIANLQWVTIQINRIKNDLTHDEFLALCALVASRSTDVAKLSLR
jgi:hypothetical protein